VGEEISFINAADRFNQTREIQKGKNRELCIVGEEGLSSSPNRTGAKEGRHRSGDIKKKTAAKKKGKLKLGENPRRRKKGGR